MDNVDEIILALFLKYVLPLVAAMMLVLLGVVGYFCKRWMGGIESNVKTIQTEVRTLNEKVDGMKEQRHSDNVAIRKELHIVEDNLMDKEIRPLREVMRAETNRILEQHRNDMTGIREEIMELIKRNIKP